MLVLVLAVALVGTVLRPALPAAADEVPIDPPVLISSLPPGTTSSSSAVQVIQLDGGDIQINNPGGSVPFGQQCLNYDDVTHIPVPSENTGQQLCVGQSGQLLIGGGNQPIQVQSYLDYTEAYHAGLGWIVREAEGAIANLHDLDDTSLVGRFARAEIRAYVYARLQNIVEKVLYGEDLTIQEKATYDALVEWYKRRNGYQAKNVLAEYQRWEADPCGYVPPTPPPGSLLDVPPNPVRGTAACANANPLIQAWKFTKGTPPVEVFEAWAQARHPDALTKLSSNPLTRGMVAETVAGLVALGGIGVSAAAAGIAVAIGLGMTAATAKAIAAVTGVAIHAIAHGTITTGLGITLTAASVASVVGIVLFALITTAVAIWQLVEDQKPGEEIRRRAATAVGDDPFQMGTYQPLYAGLDFDTHEKPDGQVSPIHKPEFGQQLLAFVLENTAFDGNGNLKPDPVAGFDEAQQDTDKAFEVGGDRKDSIAMVAAPDAVDIDGQRISGYEVWFRKGWLMVRPYLTDKQQWGPVRPRLWVDFVDGEGRPARLSVVKYADEDGVPQRGLSITRFDDDGEEQEAELTDTFTFKSPEGNRTATLTLDPPKLPEYSVLATVKGKLLPGHNVTLYAHPSEPVYAVQPPPTYTWTVERFGEDGQVVDSFTRNNLGFQHAFDEPGAYRATVAMKKEGAGGFERTSFVDFTIARPAPDTFQAPELVDNRKLHKSVHLNLHFEEPVPEDELTVEIDWAHAPDGSTITETYQVDCVPRGDGTCETGALGGGAAPTNPQWHGKSPTYQIPDDRHFLPYITARVTNSYGATWEWSGRLEGDHLPRFVDPAPYATMPVGKHSEVKIVEAVPSTLYDNQELTIYPYVEQLSEYLPPGVLIDLVQEGGRYWVVAKGTPQTKDIGPRTFPVALEQQPWGSGLKTPPVLATLDIRPSSDRGYRAILTNVPGEFSERFPRTDWPDWYVMVAEEDGDGPELTEEFTGTVVCELRSFDMQVFQKPCQPGTRFPWPKNLVDSNYTARVTAESDGQPLSADGTYEASFIARFLDPRLKVAKSGPAARYDRVELRLSDGKYSYVGWVDPPFSSQGFVVECRVDDAKKFRPCLDNGSHRVLRTPGKHRLVLRVEAPDGAVQQRSITWKVATPPKKLRVSAPASVRRGAALTIKVAGLLPRERTTVRLLGKKVVTTADRRGRVTVKVRVPSTVPVGARKTVTVTGETAKRKGVTTVRVRR